MNKTTEIIEKLSSISARPIENLELVSKYINESITKKSPITFYNWECPPRFLDKDEKGDTFINYCVNLEEIKKNKKIDSFTEIPRAIERARDEVKILNFLIELGLNFQFIKLIADTNPYYITPESMKIMGKERIIDANNKFKKMISQAVKIYPSQVKVVLFTELIKPFEAVYEKSFNEALALLETTQNNLVNSSIYNEQIERTKEHIGLTSENKIREFTNRTIATYAAEGMVFDKLSKSTNFFNSTWLNIEEVDERTIEITNSLRNKNSIGKLPMFFPDIERLIN